MNQARRILLLLLIVLSTVGCDQSAKLIARENLLGKPPISLLGGAIHLLYTHNPGAILSLGAGLDPQLRFTIFVILAALLLVVMAVFLLRVRQISALQFVSLSLLLGGGAGNLIDRLLHDGEVIDFVYLSLAGLHTGIFNLADAAIFAGAFLFLLSYLLQKPAQQPRPDESTGQSDSE